MKLTDLSYIKSLMAAHNLHFKKQYGQNFLTNETVLQRIAQNASDGVLEIGPGIGSLTYVLAQNCKKVVTVEIDTALIPVLHETLQEFDNVEIIHSDVLKLDLPALIAERFGEMPVSVCANLPYYVTTPIIMALLESRIPFENITVMIQKEVAHRLCASAGDADYGAVTAAVSYYARVTKLFDVAPGNFIPAPNVTSSVISIEPHKTLPVQPKDEATFFRVIKGAFALRRKTLLNSLHTVFSEWSKEELGALLQKAGISPTVRGETLSIAQFATIADVLFDEKSSHRTA